ncbi:sugar kinase [Holotrichia oblita]|uniref:Sugar kinase n=1 Tax=Holotrichia oblita TaxID=644536 RepID=A0ACB9TNE3_HOLOL|nr:sugar kinase [Holotrichia oblita]
MSFLPTMQSGAHLIYLFSRKDRFLMGSRLKLSTIQCTSRLLWVLQNIPEVREAASKHNLCFGTIDTWLVHKLTGGTKFITEVSNASSTALFDPFVMDWSDVPTIIMKIPKHIFPQIVNSDYDFGYTIPEIFGTSIRIGSVIADQQASMFGSFCFKRKDLKITIGTGSFININTDGQPVASAEGTYPLVAWTLNNVSTYVTEASCKDAGSLIQWALDTGIASEVSKIAAQAYSVKDSDGVFFIPAFSGLGPPLSDDLAATGFLGLKPTTTKNHMMRAILESIVYTVVTAYNTLHHDKHYELKQISVDGGVSNNDFVCQLLADVLNLSVVRYISHERTILGATFLAGLNTGIHRSLIIANHGYINSRCYFAIAVIFLFFTA